MYVTRYLSEYKSSPESLDSPPPEGPNSGYLVIQDEESETYSWFGLWKNKYLRGLPFPQNKTLTTRYSSGSGEHRRVSYDEVVLIPVLNQPLSSNRYYAIKPHGSHKGEAFACSKEEDMTSCCFCMSVSDVKPRPLDPHDVYQQFEVVPYATVFSSGGRFYARSLAEDGYPPHFLRRKGWEIYTKTPKNYQLSEAKGINNSLRSHLPELNFPPSTKSSDSVVVGKWYCPFVFIKEGTLALADQVKKCMYYVMTLEQRWERVFQKENEQGNVVSVKAAIRSEAVFIGEKGREAIWDERNVVDGTVWFSCPPDHYEKEEGVGLSLKIVERMKWEEENFGWVAAIGDKRIHTLNKQEMYEGGGVWKRIGSYVLVERFVLKRMDGSLVLEYDFGHARQIKSIFE